MQKNNIGVTALACIVPILFLRPACVQAQAGKAPYPVMGFCRVGELWLSRGLERFRGGLRFLRHGRCVVRYLCML